MRISDWSSDVCSSDLLYPGVAEALATLPRGNAFVFRHYHLEYEARRKRFEELKDVAKSGDHLMVLSGEADVAIEWGADGIYGPPGRLGQRPGRLRSEERRGGKECVSTCRSGGE